MSARPSMGMPKLSRRSRILLILGGVVLIGLIVGSRLLGVYIDWIWYSAVGYRGVFDTVAMTRTVLWACVTLFLGGLLALNLWIAYRTRPVFLPVSGPDDPLARYRTVVAERAKLFGVGIPAVIGLIGGLAAQGDWQIVQLFLHATPFQIPDPIFGHDIGFYTFQLPFYRWLLSWAFIATTISFFGALITHYIFGGIRLAGRSGQLSGPARVQLAIVAGLFVLLKAVDYFFDRYDLLLSQRKGDLFTGASYTDLNAVMPADLILMCIAIFCAIAFFAAVFLRNLQIPALATVLLVLSSLLVGTVWPALLEQIRVSPNANQSEQEPIRHNIEATRHAFDIGKDRVHVTDYPGKTNLAPHEVAADTGTIPNARLLDPNVLSDTFTQLTQQYNFYGYPPKLDVDRYRDASGKLQDYLVALREINTPGLAANQQSWINRHMVFTHGNGFVSAPADRVDSTLQEGESKGGYPVFSISDATNNGNGGPGSIPVAQPRVYFGELISDYSIVGADPGDKPREYDTDRQAHTYHGKGGVPIGNWFRRLAFAAYHGERNILFNQEIGDNSRIIFNRNPRDRVQKAAPWLKLDGDPYPTVIDGRVQWIVDGYTTLDNYPYSKTTPFGPGNADSARQRSQNINYIRNSVKATVDAYNGTVHLYSVDDKDPVLKAWQGVFPGTVQPLSSVPPPLRDQLAEHFRYPKDQFEVQRALLGRYHVDNPRDFFETHGFWEVPPDPTGGLGGTNRGSPQPPYYVVAQVPGQRDPRFQLTSALTVLGRQNIGAWVSASADPRDRGKITVLKLPTQAQTPGPDQVQNQMESTPKVTEDRTLFNNRNVQPIFGNLLTLPVKGGLLYVEPVYIKRKDVNSFPQLARVIVAFGQNIGFDRTFGGALDQVFGPGAGQSVREQGQQGQNAQPPTPRPPNQQLPRPTTDPQVQQTISNIQNALQRLRAAQQSGNFAEIGAAQQQLSDAATQFQQLQGSGG